MIRKAANYEDRIGRVTRHIYENLDGDLSFGALADVAAMSSFHWHRIYHAMRGETAVATAKRLRLQRASAQLAHTQKPIGEIAVRCGYSGVQAFTRAFADAFGVPPATYRSSGSHADFRPGELPPPRAHWAVEVKTLPSIPLLSLAHKGSYMEIGRTFEALFGRLRPQDTVPPGIRMIAVFMDDPTLVEEAALRSHAAFAGSQLQTRHEPVEALHTRPGDYAVLRHKGPYADMRSAYRWLFGTWLPQSGREAGEAPVIEEYLNSPHDTPPPDLLTELCLPLL